MKKPSTILLVLLFSLQLFNAQTIKSPKEKQTDSLQLVIKNAKHDTIILNALKILKNSNSQDKEKELEVTLRIEKLCRKNLEKKLVEKEIVFYKYALANSLYSLGFIYYQKGKTTDAINSIEQSLILFEPLDTEKFANSINSLGVLYQRLGNYTLAVDYYDRSLSIYQETGDKKGIASCLSNLGTANQERGDYPKAVGFYSRSLSFREEIGDKNGVANCLNNLGNVYRRQGNLSQALYYIKQSLNLKQETGNKQGIAASLQNLGSVYEEQGDLAKAGDHYKRSLNIMEKLADNYGIAKALGNLGRVYYTQGDYEQAIAYINRSLTILEEFGDKKGIASCLSNLGVMYKTQGNYQLAVDYGKRSLKLQEEMGDKVGISTSLGNLGNIYEEQGNYPEALSNCKLSLIIKEEIGDKETITLSLNNLGNLFKKHRDFMQGIKYCKQALILALESGSTDPIRDASRSLFQQYSLLNSMDSSLIYLHILKSSRDQEIEKNYFTLSEHEKELYFTTMEADYGLYYDFASYYYKKCMNSPDTAYNIALMTKGLTLKSSTAMREAVKSSGDTILVREYESWMQLKRTISQKYGEGANTKDLENKANELERELVKKSTAFSDFDKIKKLDWKQVQAGLKKDEAAIEFVNFKSEIDTTHPIVYVALLIKPGMQHPQIIKLCTEKDLEKILGAFQGNNLNYVNSVYGTKTKAQKALYEKVWQPLEEYLQGTTKVFLSPSGLLHKVSFAAMSKDKNIFLCDRYQINQQSSTGRVILGKPFKLNDNANLLLFGGVQYSSDSTKNEIWKYLPGTLNETQNIIKGLKKQKVNVTEATGKKADELVFKTEAPKANILHVSTHGFFFPDPEKIREEQKKNIEQNKEIAFRGAGQYGEWSFMKNKNPLMRSGLALAGANDAWNRDPMTQGEDGVLTASEVSNLNLQNTQLVVLSACETGLGDIKGSEGVFGLQRAFKIAGANYIMMSLWQVPDKETSEFMTTFYDKLIKIKDIKKSFNDTQKEMRKKYDPFYWGAFVLIE